MGEVVEFRNGIASPIIEDQSADDMFMFQEGLELLAAYRALRDPALRGSLITMIRALVLSQPSRSE